MPPAYFSDTSMIRTAVGPRRRVGKLYHRTDKREQAKEHLTTATTMYREMDMTYWLEKAEAEMTKRGG